MNSRLSRIDKRLGRGSELTRSVYGASRRLLHRRDLASRRRVARGLAVDPGFAIPDDRGFRVIPPGPIPEALDVAREVRRLAARFEDDPETSREKPQLVTGLLSRSELTLDSPFVRLALHPGLLRAASRYLGCVPIVADLDVWISVPDPGLANSQLFHCDWADSSQVKVFVYGSHVDEDSGPLVAVAASASKQLRQRLSYRWKGERYRVADEVVRSLVGDGDRRMLLGPPGTVVLVDTSGCFHYGSRVAAGAARAVGMVQFLRPSAFSLSGSSRARGALSHLETPRMSQLERLALGGA